MKRFALTTAFVLGIGLTSFANTEKGIEDWGRPVTDQEYNSIK